MENQNAHAVGRLEGKVDTLILMYTEERKRFDKVEDRLGSVEKKVWWAYGAAALLVTFVTKLGLNHLGMMA
jgi:hypothetical protein